MAPVARARIRERLARHVAADREDVAGVLRRLAEEAEQTHQGIGAPAVETIGSVFVPPARLLYLAELAEAGEL